MFLHSEKQLRAVQNAESLLWRMIYIYILLLDLADLVDRALRLRVLLVVFFVDEIGPLCVAFLTLLKHIIEFGFSGLLKHCIPNAFIYIGDPVRLKLIV